jgi:hypothetical protein
MLLAFQFVMIVVLLCPASTMFLRVGLSIQPRGRHGPSRPAGASRPALSPGPSSLSRKSIPSAKVGTSRVDLVVFTGRRASVGAGAQSPRAAPTQILWDRGYCVNLNASLPISPHICHLLIID